MCAARLCSISIFFFCYCASGPLLFVIFPFRSRVCWTISVWIYDVRTMVFKEYGNGPHDFAVTVVPFFLLSGQCVYFVWTCFKDVLGILV